MATISTTSYVLDSRKRTSGSTTPIAVFDLAVLGSPVEVGTMSMIQMMRYITKKMQEQNWVLYCFLMDIILQRLI